MKTEREKFFEFYKNRYFQNGVVSWMPSSESYSNQDVQLAWESWQAAVASRGEEVEHLKARLELDRQHLAYVCEPSEALEEALKELTELRAFKEAIEAQEPVGWMHNGTIGRLGNPLICTYKMNDVYDTPLFTNKLEK